MEGKRAVRHWFHLSLSPSVLLSQFPCGFSFHQTLCPCFACPHNPHFSFLFSFSFSFFLLELRANCYLLQFFVNIRIYPFIFQKFNILIIILRFQIIQYYTIITTGFFSSHKNFKCLLNPEPTPSRTMDHSNQLGQLMFNWSNYDYWTLGGCRGSHLHQKTVSDVFFPSILLLKFLKVPIHEASEACVIDLYQSWISL